MSKAGSGRAPTDSTARSLETMKKQIDMILQRLDAIEDRIGELMTEDEIRDYDIALDEYSRGKSIPLDEARKLV